MKHEYEINRRYEFKATADSVCPVPDDAEVIVWFGTRSEPNRKANFWSWDETITHFLVTSYPKTKHKAWMNCYPDGRAEPHKTKEDADRYAHFERVDCVEIAWDAE